MALTDSIFVHALESLGKTRFRSARSAGKNLAGSLVVNLQKELSESPLYPPRISQSENQSENGLSKGVFLTTQETAHARLQLTKSIAYCSAMVTECVENNDWFGAVTFKTARYYIKAVRLHLRAEYELQWPISVPGID